MNKPSTDLSKYNNADFDTGAGFIKRVIWYLTNCMFFINPFIVSSKLKVFLLQIFGADIGKNCVIKPAVNIKYPWKLKVGNHVWIGEGVWIDNLVKVKIGDHVTISQGAMLLTGNHNYKKTSFDLLLGEIHLHDGVWIGARAIVAPGVTCKSHSILTVNSVAVKDMDSYTIYQGNPARETKERNIE